MQHPEHYYFFWYGWNEAAIRITMDLLHDGFISKETAHPLTYVIDGKGLNLPIAKSLIKYKKPHWLPIVFIAIK